MNQKSGKGKTAPPPVAMPVGEEARPWWTWLDAAPVIWLVVVSSAYGVLAFYPMAPTNKEVPGVVEADRLALPLLVVTVTAGIIRYACARAAERRSGLSPAELRAERRETE